jgi:hypothetical protein
MSLQLPDPDSEFGERVARRLRDEPIAWLTHVDGAGTPQPAPVSFLWDDAAGSALVTVMARRGGSTTSTCSVYRWTFPRFAPGSSDEWPVFVGCETGRSARTMASC